MKTFRESLTLQKLHGVFYFCSSLHILTFSTHLPGTLVWKYLFFTTYSDIFHTPPWNTSLKTFILYYIFWYFPHTSLICKFENICYSLNILIFSTHLPGTLVWKHLFFTTYSDTFHTPPWNTCLKTFVLHYNLGWKMVWRS